jgi:diguanylate cyclase (GGDEF)-like protein
MLFEQHDLRLVALAAVVCALSAFAGMTLLHHGRRTSGPMRAVWLCVAAVSVGFGIWATHFVAMLSFHSGIPVGYSVELTLLSLAFAVGIVGGGLWFACLSSRTSDLVLAGVTVGIGISAMHYVGMLALVIGGRIVWAADLVVGSIMLGALLSALALVVGVGRRKPVGFRIAGAGLLTLAICSMHFTAMGAADFSNCFPVIATGEGAPAWMPLVIAIISILVLLFALGGIFLDLRERSRAQRENARMRGLADAAVEGLIVCRDGIVVTANKSFLTLVGLGEDKIVGRPFSGFLDAETRENLGAHPHQELEAELIAGSGARLPVEIIERDVDFGGVPHKAYAVRDLRARRSAEQHIRFLAHHDALTGLPNRASFNEALDEQIARAARERNCFAVLCLDLDRFKEVNDLFGHPAGDAMLKRVAMALSEVVEGRGSAARLGGDEFAVLLMDLQTPDRAGRVSEAIMDAFARANEHAGSGPMIAASIGIAVFPDNADNAEHLMSQADTALYRAKQDGRGIYRFYSAEMGAEVRERRMLEHDLRHAVSRHELHLVYQPQVDIESGEVTGFEALLRWNHPTRGTVAPAVFITIAEESGLILQIGDWVLRSACAEAASWQAPLSIAVNVSGAQVLAPNFAHEIHQMLVTTGLSPDRLEIEITETALVRDMTRAIATLRMVRALGVHIAMDDFGTGYSSLANLRAFPFSKIKVDQSFIRSVDSNGQSAAIVRAVLGLGSGLDIPVIAEGVERPEELEFLRGEICKGAQGFLISHPATIAQFRAVTSGATRQLALQPEELLKAS